MRVCGVIAEYNPLHNGHLLHLNAAREQSCCDYLAVCMSGGFVQRGEPAGVDKWQRTRWALQAGADIVLELPAVFVLQSAQYFAQGGVRTLAHTGMDTLCFGSEYADAALIRRAATLLDASGAHIKRQLASGKSYARSAGDALEPLDACVHGALKSPNFMLGVEYSRSLDRYSPQTGILPIKRKGGGHNDASINGEVASASAIRSALLLGDGSAARALPEFVVCGRPATLSGLGQSILYKLRTTPASQLDYCGIAEGLENVLARAGANANSLDELLSMIKTKRYTMSRVKRVLCCMLLGVASGLAEWANGNPPGYLRVLGLKKTAQPLLKKLSLCGTPLVCKKADMDALPEMARRVLAADILASDLQALAAGLGAAQRDYTQKLIVV